MITKLLILAVLLTVAGCSYITVNITGDTNKTSIEQPRTISTEAVNPSGNTVPVSAVP